MYLKNFFKKIIKEHKLSIIYSKGQINSLTRERVEKDFKESERTYKNIGIVEVGQLTEEEIIKTTIKLVVTLEDVISIDTIYDKENKFTLMKVILGFSYYNKDDIVEIAENYLE